MKRPKDLRSPTFMADARGPRSVARVSWEMHNGPIPKGLFICHRCDNPPCVRPDHLFLGTARDNQQDMRQKGRHFDLEGWMRQHPERRSTRPMPGEANPAARLTEADVLYIRNAWPRERQTALAHRFGVAQGIIWSILHGKSWKHVGGPIHPMGKRGEIPKVA